MNPYLVLGVPVPADDPTIRRAYLEGIKLATPEKNPTRFKALSEAYERIKDEASRCKYELFHQESPGASPLDTILRHL
ncbi:MAG: J domain-containing protein, partial [Verrucomicrobiota bacterium]